MRTAYIDCVFGVSGDMILGALVACGVPLETLECELGKLNITGFSLRGEKVSHAGIAAQRIEVLTENQHEHRHLSHIRDIIESSALSDRVKRQAVDIFTRLAEAEARVHGTLPETVHFHEVGALDAIVDVVGACIGLEYLNVDTVVSTPLYLGTGMIECRHGMMPVPVPAVVELTRNIPVVRTGIEGEMTTPTGAAIVTTLASSYGPAEAFTPVAVGYGAGSRRREHIPNVLRITVGESRTDYDEDRCVLVETNIDDMNPELFGYVSGRLFEAGAKDVWTTPVIMKKGRPGTILSVLAEVHDADMIADTLFTETTTIGVRLTEVARKKLRREERTIETRYGPVLVKVVFVNSGERITPEYEDCVRIARKQGIPLQEVYDEVRRSFAR